MGVDEPLLVEAHHGTKHNWLRIRNLVVAGVLVVVVVIVVVGVLLLGVDNNAPTSNRLLTGSYKIASTDVYVAGSSDNVIFIMPDINGMSVEVKQIADFYSQGGFTAIVVDYFNGDPRNASDPTWGDRHPANLSLALATGVIASVKTRGYSNFQVQGYCYGGRTGVSLTFANNTALMRSAVVAHPANLVAADASLITTPIFFVMPQTDTFNSLAPYFNTTLIDRNIPAVFKIYPNTTHGFAVSATSNPVQKKLLWRIV